jgi:hypothetical protein
MDIRWQKYWVNIPPLGLADSAQAFSTHEGATKAKRVVEATPSSKDKNKEPTRSPSGDATMVDQIKLLQASQIHFEEKNGTTD